MGESDDRVSAVMMASAPEEKVARGVGAVGEGGAPVDLLDATVGLPSFLDDIFRLVASPT